MGEGLTDRQHRNFWAKVRVNPETGCHEWTAALRASGYGTFNRCGKQVLAHRLAYELYHGPIPEGTGYHGTCVLHVCDNKRCVRKEHLRIGSNQDNMDDMVAKQRQARNYGLVNGHATHSKETIARVRELRALGWRQHWIGRELGMTQGYVSAILLGKKRVFA